MSKLDWSKDRGRQLVREASIAAARSAPDPSLPNRRALPRGPVTPSVPNPTSLIRCGLCQAELKAKNLARHSEKCPRRPARNPPPAPESAQRDNARAPAGHRVLFETDGSLAVQIRVSTGALGTFLVAADARARLAKRGFRSGMELPRSVILEGLKGKWLLPVGAPAKVVEPVTPAADVSRAPVARASADRPVSSAAREEADWTLLLRSLHSLAIETLQLCDAMWDARAPDGPALDNMFMAVFRSSEDARERLAEATERLAAQAASSPKGASPHDEVQPRSDV
jgi:hypothetical protein